MSDPLQPMTISRDAQPADQAHGPRVRIGTTNNDPELEETIPITGAKDPRRWHVVMRLGPDSKSDDPMPDLRPGDRLRVFAELEVTTDAEQKNHPGLMGDPYSFDPLVEARFLLAQNRNATEPAGNKAIVIDRWSAKCSHRRHHEIVLLSGREVVVPDSWSGQGFINLALSASHPDARPGHRLLIGENEDTKTVDQDISGIRLLRLRPGRQAAVKSTRLTKLAVPHLRVAKEATVMLSMPVDDLKRNEQLLVHGRLIANGADVGYDARLSARMFLSDEPGHTEPKGHVDEVASWKGHLSKENGSNCLNGDGPRAAEKFGVLRMKKDARRRVFVNLTATSSAPFLPNRTPGDRLPIKRGSFIDLTRFGPEFFG